MFNDLFVPLEAEIIWIIIIPIF